MANSCRLSRVNSSWLAASEEAISWLTCSWTGTEEDWLGVESATMYWSHQDAGTYRRWLTDLGYVIHEDHFVPEGDGGHRLFFAQLRE